MNLRYADRFRGAFLALTDTERTQIRQALKLFMSNPRHPSLRLRKLSGRRNIWYMRAGRDLRITLQKDGDIWTLRVVGHHDKALGQP